jgi:hypothetical protein
MERWIGGAWLAAGLLTLAGCGWLDPTPRLRVTNAGTTPIENLTVLFPEDRIPFGDIPVGGTTGYEEVPNGVYAYAAYRLDLDGATVSQPVIDWVGEEPMEGEAFTYVLEVDPLGSPFQVVRLVSASRDE